MGGSLKNKSKHNKGELDCVFKTFCYFSRISSNDV